MASSAEDPETKSYEISVVQATGIARVKFTLGKDIRAYVQIDAANGAANYSWKTKDVAWTEGGDLRWDERFTLLPLPSAAKITFSLFRDSRGFKPSKSLGSLEIRLAELLALCARHHGEEITLSLDKKNQRTGELTVHIKNASTTALESAVKHLPGAGADLVGSQLGAAADAISTTADASNSSLVGSFTSLMGSLDVLVKIADEIAKIHPWANLAWNVLSVGLKLVKAQQDRDTQITKLVQTMQSIYSTVAGSDTLKNDKVLQDVLEQILKQTILCGFFIQKYMRPRALAAVTEAFTSTDSLISRYLDTFKQLRDDYVGRIATHTALVTRDIASTVHDIRFDQLMDKLKPVDMNQMNRGVCLPNTRLNIIKSIMDWYSDTSDQRQNVMWLYGWAGTGKSTLSTTIARMVQDLDLLGAFFFFDRQLPERNFSTVIRTIAYRLAQFDVDIGAKVEQVLKDTPDIADMPLSIQFSKLLSAAALGGIQWSKGPILVVIDALDESGGIAERKELLRVLSEGSADLPPFVRLLIVSRPERDISGRFKPSSVRCEELRIDAKTSQADITEFIRARLQEVRQENIEFLPEALQFWPSDYDIQCLAALAAGLFIWAATACRLIDASHDPKESTNKLIKQNPSDIYNSIFTNLYHLYKTALQSAGNWEDQSFCSDFQNILGTILSAQTPLSCLALDALLGLPRPSFLTVSRLGSVLRGSREEPIRILHTSFQDYLRLREPDEPWAIKNGQYNTQLAYRCIAHLEQELRENMCDLTLPHPVTDESLPDSVLYASKYWIEHVCSITDVSDSLGHSIFEFMHKHLLHWIEALTIIKAYDVVMRLLPKLLKWTQIHFPGSKLYLYVHDAHRFAQYFANTIMEHPLLIYASAVPFTPHGTIVYKTFHNTKLPHVISGIEPTWPSLQQVLLGHEDQVLSVAFSPDGTKIVSGSRDKTVRVWDAVTGQAALPPLEGHDHWVWSVVFSPDGTKIVSGSRDRTVRVWDTVTGHAALPPLEGHEDDVNSVAFSPDGTRIVSGSSDKTVRVWDAVTGQKDLPPLEGHEGQVWSVVFSPDSTKIVSGSRDKTVRVWDAVTGQAALPPLEGHGDPVWSVAFSPDGTKIASGSWDKTVRVWDAVTGHVALPPLEGHENSVLSVAFSPDGTIIVSGSSDKTVRVWDAVTGQAALPPLEGHEDRVGSISFSPDGTKIVSGSWDKTVRVWDAVTGRAALPPLEGHEEDVWSVAFSLDDTMIVSGSADNTVRVWDANTGRAALPPLEGHEDNVWSVAFSPDGTKIVSGSWDKTVRVWDAVTGHAALPPLEGHDNGVLSVAFSPGGTMIVSGSADKTVRVWDAITGQAALPLLEGHEDQVWSVAFSPDSTKIVSGSKDKTLRVWDAVTGHATLPPLEGHEDNVNSVAFSPDGTMIVSGSSDKTVRVWDAVTGQKALPQLGSHEDPVWSVAFSPDGTKIVSASDDKTIRVWDAITGQLFNGDRGDALIPHHTSYNESQICLSLNEQGYFTDVNSGHYLGKIPVGFAFTRATCRGSRCIIWKEASSNHWVPVIIHLPSA